jgi:hypothetical protein
MENNFRFQLAIWRAAGLAAFEPRGLAKGEVVNCGAKIKAALYLMYKAAW